ncbi:hypothetical protein JOB18_003562 [Solea senegalensis]|uniref:Uncharacterized protein n=1 Tax=Solea senegalensis TaxID=28829 RepID=A0AAV6RA37_SOLSE|nr:hypothetical protein JOB18_003562 [Solea senegalensis]
MLVCSHCKKEQPLKQRRKKKLQRFDEKREEWELGHKKNHNLASIKDEATSCWRSVGITPLDFNAVDAKGAGEERPPQVLLITSVISGRAGEEEPPQVLLITSVISESRGGHSKAQYPPPFILPDISRRLLLSFVCHKSPCEDQLCQMADSISNLTSVQMMM